MKVNEKPLRCAMTSQLVLLQVDIKKVIEQQAAEQILM